MTKTGALEAALAHFGGSPTAMARAVGGDVQRQHVEHWIKQGAVPVPHCAAVEAACGGVVTRRQLQPEVWHRVWPELVTAEHPAPPLSPSPTQP